MTDEDDDVVGSGWSRTGSLRIPPIEGVVTGLHGRTERRLLAPVRRTEHVVTFTVERQDSVGNPLPAVSIEMRGPGFAGELREGDRVQLPGRFAVGSVLRIERLQNVTEGAVFATKGPPLASVVLGLSALLAVAGAVLSFFARFILG